MPSNVLSNTEIQDTRIGKRSVGSMAYIIYCIFPKARGIRAMSYYISLASVVEANTPTKY